MGMTERDRKLMMIFGAVLGLIVLWMFVISPKKADVAAAQLERDSAASTLETAKQAVLKGNAEKKRYRVRYNQVVRLGKAIPSSTDDATLLRQISHAIKKERLQIPTISVGKLTASAGGSSDSGVILPTSSKCEAGAAAGATGATGATSTAVPAPAAPGATTGVGGTVNSATGAANTASGDANRAAGTTADDCAEAPLAADVAAIASGIKVRSMNLTFKGEFVDLYKFFQRIDGLVVRTPKDVKVYGRLIQVRSVSLSVEKFPLLSATVSTSIYEMPIEEAAGSSAAPVAGGAATTAAAPAAAPAAAAPPASSVSLMPMLFGGGN